MKVQYYICNKCEPRDYLEFVLRNESSPKYKKIISLYNL